MKKIKYIANALFLVTWLLILSSVVTIICIIWGVENSWKLFITECVLVLLFAMLWGIFNTVIEENENNTKLN